jgi:glutamate-1-semialdehyde 2,1-aminomutase
MLETWLGFVQASAERWIAAVMRGEPLAVTVCVVAAIATYLAGRRLLAGMMTLRARALTPPLSRVLSRIVGSVDYSLDEMLRADGADEKWIDARRAGLAHLSDTLARRHAKSTAWGDHVREGFSDLRFTDANRVPFPFARVVREQFNLCSVVTATRGPRLLDLDERWSLDVSGAYGVNVAGYDRYKEWMRRGLERVADVGPVLGPLHPVVAENVALLRALSGMDEVSFHMSGTEAVMAAVRMVRHNTRRKYVMSFSGAYHGWWDGVQPGLGSERALPDCIALKDMDPASLDAIRWRAREIAAVIVNPVQCFHPNSPPPSDAVLVTSDVRTTQDETAGYAAWLRRVREVCTEHGVPLIFDEVYTGFRLAPGGAQEYFGVQADMVVYGKTVAGGMPIGVVCGRRNLMQRFDPERPMRIAYVIGTFSAHPVVMGAMREFLGWVTDPATAELYAASNRRCAEWACDTNALLEKHGLPIRIVHLATVWTVLFGEPSRYNWLLQYYLRAEGTNLSWVGTGRCLTSMDFDVQDYRELGEKLVGAARAMQRDGWWLSDSDDPRRERKMKMRVVREMLGSVFGLPGMLKAFTAEVLERKKEDHRASHNNRINQALHLLSSSVFLCCYVLAFFDLTTAMWLGLAALFVRQLGHAVFEPPCHEREKTLLGFTTRNKTMIVAIYIATPFAHLVAAGAFGWDAFMTALPNIAWHWFLFTLLVVMGRVAYLVWTHGLWSSAIWFVKLITDPVSDIFAYSPIRLRRA